MQRTVYSTKFTYVVNEIDDNGSIASRLADVTIHESDPKKAYRLAVKKVGNFVPIKTEKIGALYVLDDEIFFKYATIKTDGNTDSEAEGA